MAKSQRSDVNPPGPEDRQELKDYSAVIQSNLGQLFNSAHDHVILSAKPGVNDGSVQTLSIVDDGTNVYLVVKTKRGWFKSANFSAL